MSNSDGFRNTNNGDKIDNWCQSRGSEKQNYFLFRLKDMENRFKEGDPVKIINSEFRGTVQRITGNKENIVSLDVGGTALYLDDELELNKSLIIWSILKEIGH